MAPRDGLAAPEDATGDEGASSEVVIIVLIIISLKDFTSRMMKMNHAVAQ